MKLFDKKGVSFMWLVVGLLLLIPYSVQAELCVENNTQKCAELGYTEPYCPYGGVACQYDTSKWHCAEWECKDGKYYTADNKPSDYDCEEIEYKGLTCYDCSVECINSQVDYNTCWGGQLLQLVRNPEFCETIGYIHSSSDCTEYIICPADLSKVRCLN